MRESFLRFSPHAISEAEIDAVVQTLRSEWITTGPRVKQFEERFAKRVTAPAALGLNSCTAALHVALKALSIGPGDAVITTPMTFAASVNVIEHVGARPILVDVDPRTLAIDPNRVEDALRKPQTADRIRAILPVHLYGHPVDVAALTALAQRHELAMIEDAAHALPSCANGTPIGAAREDSGVPVLTAFSFYATKNLTTIEGGMLTGPQVLVDEARMWSLHGMSRDAWKRYGTSGTWFYEITRPGFKYNMTDVQAAIGLTQLERLDGLQSRRREVAEEYDAELRDCDMLQMPARLPDAQHAWHIFALRLNTELFSWFADSPDPGHVRARFIEELASRNIGSSVHFIPISSHPYYRERYGFSDADFPVASREYQRLVSLPLHPGLSPSDVRDVIDAVRNICDTFRAA